MDILKEIQVIISDIMICDEEDISLDSRFVEDLGVDSLDAIEIIMDVEDLFSIGISEEQSDKMHTVGDMVKFLETQI